MIAQTSSATLLGVDAIEVQIECHLSEGNQFRVTLVGLPDTAVKESRDRVLAAVRNSGFITPSSGYITFNLAPANLRKEGAAFDLPLALTLIAQNEALDLQLLKQCCAVGELALSGEVRPVKGIIAIALEARAKGHRYLLVPKQVAAEASIISGIDIIGVHSLREAFEFLQGSKSLISEPCRAQEFFSQNCDYGIDFGEVRGQEEAKRALEIAAAGAHNLLMIGPPGTGKSMLAKRLPTILPPMNEVEAIESTKVHSAHGSYRSRTHFLATRPFRAPHHTISDAGLLGGGSHPAPGEVSLAHHGVLFLDELPEFRRSTLEVMRQPLEDGHVTVSRSLSSITFPAQFMLIAAMNPCACGYYGDPRRECRCSSQSLHKYRQRISGPLLDRIDLHVEVPAINYQTLSREENGESSAAIRQRVQQARALQAQRFQHEKRPTCNANMPSRLLRQHCQLNPESRRYLQHAMDHLHLSARAHDRILKVARTLADLANEAQIQTQHILEAVNYRSLDRGL